MTLGERIRLARKSAGITQTELAGNFITRNMLSKIENDSVYPSLQTLLYISERLRIPVGEFFTDDDSNSAELRFRESEIRRLFLEGDSDLCIEFCEKYSEAVSDEMNLIRSVVYLRRGEYNYQNDKIDCAYKDFKSSLFYSARTAYVSADAVRHAKIMIDEIERVKPFPNGLGTAEGSLNGIIPLQNSFEQIFAERVIERTISERNFAAAEKMINDILPEGSIYKKRCVLFLRQKAEIRKARQYICVSLPRMILYVLPNDISSGVILNSFMLTCSTMTRRICAQEHGQTYSDIFEKKTSEFYLQYY